MVTLADKERPRHRFRIGKVFPKSARELY